MRLDTIDRRTRRDADIVDLSAERFFSELLPDLLTRNGHLVSAGIDNLRARPLTIDVEGFRRTIFDDGSSVRAIEDDAVGALVIFMEAKQFSDWAQQLRSLNAMTVFGELRWQDESDADRQLMVWDALWLALVEGWPVVDPSMSFLDRRGAPIDLGRCFTPDDDPRDVAHFLREAGYLHLRGWLDPAQMAVVSDDIDRATTQYRDGDDRSWWATLADGTRRCVRLQNFVEHSATTEAILMGDQWDRLLHIISGDDDLVAGPVEGNCIEALIKPLGVGKGVSDIPWHRDCNFGRHAYGCSGAVIGLSVTPGGETSGQLQVVAGSHRLAVPPLLAATESPLPVIPISTETADITVHLTCTIHAALPPLTAERKVMYTGFHLASLTNAHPVEQSTVDRLRERVHKIASQPASPLAKSPKATVQ